MEIGTTHIIMASTQGTTNKINSVESEPEREKMKWKISATHASFHGDTASEIDNFFASLFRRNDGKI